MEKLDPKAVWLFFFGKTPGVIFIYAAIFIGYGLQLISNMSTITLSSANFITFGFLFLILFILVFFLGYFWAVLSYRNYFYGLLDDGFRKEHGVIYKKYVTIPYNRIQNVDIHRGILDRLLGLSRIKIQTAGGISTGSYGASAEGYLPGIDKNKAEEIRNELIRRAQNNSNQNIGAI